MGHFKSHKKLYGKLKIIVLVSPQNLTNWLFILIKNSIMRAIVLANMCRSEKCMVDFQLANQFSLFQ